MYQRAKKIFKAFGYVRSQEITETKDRNSR